MTDAGYLVDTAEDGVVGWKMIQAKPYELLITDNKMPRVTGVELVQKIQAAAMTIPIIMVTATPPENVEELQLAAILGKPFGISQLLRMVAEALHEQLQNRNVPKLKKIARQLLATGTATVRPSGDDGRVVFQVCDKLRGPLSQLLGSIGFHSLMIRSLVLAKAEVPGLAGVHVNADGSLAGLDDLAPHNAAAAETMLVSQLLGLLLTLIGPALTLQLLSDTWPDLPSLTL